VFLKSLILASQSPYRKRLLERLGLNFQSISPRLDEDRLKADLLNSGFGYRELAEELAKAKSLSLDEEANQSIVIASDQLLHLDGKILGKSHDINKAIAQLRSMQGRYHELITSVSVCVNGKIAETWSVESLMKMRALTEADIKSYLELDLPFDCAGSYKLEKAGIKLFESIQCEDWTAIEGLPLISLSEKLRVYGIFGANNIPLN